MHSRCSLDNGNRFNVFIACLVNHVEVQQVQVLIQSKCLTDLCSRLLFIKIPLTCKECTYQGGQWIQNRRCWWSGKWIFQLETSSGVDTTNGYQLTILGVHHTIAILVVLTHRQIQLIGTLLVRGSAGLAIIHHSICIHIEENTRTRNQPIGNDTQMTGFIVSNRDLNGRQFRVEGSHVQCDCFISIHQLIVQGCDSKSHLGVTLSDRKDGIG